MADHTHPPPGPRARTAFRPRVWPGVVVLAVSLVLLVAPAFVVERSDVQFMLLMVGAMAASVGGTIWWAASSRAPLVDRVLALALFLLPAVGFCVEESLDAPGQPPMGVMVYGLPFVFLCWVAGLVVGLPSPGRVRRPLMYLALLLGWLAFGLVRIDGTTGGLVPEFNWRWTKKPEDAAKDIRRETVDVTTDVRVDGDDWAEFRGPHRTNAVDRVTLDPDWAATPPQKVWEVDVGPGWGAFAVAGDRLYTMEQQGTGEAVVCLDAATGKMAWKRPHTYPAIFKEKISGAGPRSTPTVKDGRVYTFGATAELCCLDAATGEKVWQVNAAGLTGAKPPTPFWGYASSPLVYNGRVIVCVPDQGTAAFSATDGTLAWKAGKATHGYSSATLVSFAPISGPQVLMMSNHGLESFDPDSGKLLWEHAWPMAGGNRSLQPMRVDGNQFLVTSGVGTVLGSRLIRVTGGGGSDGGGGGVKAETVWETGREFSPYFNDGVLYARHYYGFSGSNFVCVDLDTGKVKWDEGKRHGNGQVMLFAESGHLLVTSEYGKMFLVKCDPTEYDELATAPTVPGKMWNHAAYSRGKLYVRSDRKAACIALPGEEVAGRESRDAGRPPPGHPTSSVRGEGRAGRSARDGERGRRHPRSVWRNGGTGDPSPRPGRTAPSLTGRGWCGLPPQDGPDGGGEQVAVALERAVAAVVVVPHFGHDPQPRPHLPGQPAGHGGVQPGGAGAEPLAVLEQFHPQLRLRLLGHVPRTGTAPPRTSWPTRCPAPRRCARRWRRARSSGSHSACG